MANPPHKNNHHWFHHTAIYSNRKRPTRTTWMHVIDWCCFYYFLRNSLVALLEALFAHVYVCNMKDRGNARHELLRHCFTQALQLLQQPSTLVVLPAPSLNPLTQLRMQRASAHWMLQWIEDSNPCPRRAPQFAVSRSASQYTAVCCSVLQYVAAHLSSSTLTHAPRNARRKHTPLWLWPRSKTTSCSQQTHRAPRRRAQHCRRFEEFPGAAVGVRW